MTSGRNRAIGFLVLIISSAACGGSGGEPPVTTEAQGAGSPTEAVSMLVEAIKADDPSAAGRLVAPGQMRLILLAEGSTVKDTVAADPAIAARNFWAAFADALGPDAVAGLTIRPGPASQALAVRGVDFAVVTILVDGTSRSIVTRNSGNGWFIDVVASFAEVLGPRYGSGIERALGSPEADAISGELKALGPSLEVVLELPGLDGTLQQTMLVALGLLGE